jgi:beta-galactosidase
MSRTLLNDGWSFRPTVSAFAELGGSTSDWTDVSLPHDALIGQPRSPEAPGGAASGYFPSGAFEYRKTLSPSPSDEGKQIFLEFDGVHRDAMVYINGALAGQHAFGYSRFLIRIDPYLRFGTANEVRVTCVAHKDSRWYTGAGIYRDVHLIVKNSVHIVNDGVQFVTEDVETDRALVRVIAEVANHGSTTVTADLLTFVNEEGVAEVASAASPITLLPGASGTVRQSFHIEQPALWSTDSPSLYQGVVQVRLNDSILDEESVTFGIRRIQVDARKGLRINGQTVKLRGACVHHDNGPLGAIALAAAEARKVQLLKEAGFNAIRSSHNPASSALLAACDRLGMMVVDETFDMWTSNKTDFDYATDFVQWWERDLEAFVAKDVNHPSVIAYSIGNEIPETGTAFGGVWSRRLAEKIRSLDRTRPITNGINGFVSSLDVVVAGMKEAASQASSGEGVNGMMTDAGEMMNQISASDMVTERTRESFSVLDIAGMNYGDARYLLDRDLFPDRVILGTETFPSHMASNWQLVESNPHVIGDFVWTGWDYLGEAGLGSVSYGDKPAVAREYPWLAAWSGDIDITGTRRPSSFYREIVFGLRTEPYIAVGRPDRSGQTPQMTPWSWSDTLNSWSWDGFEGTTVRVEVYAAADEVELILNGVSCGRSSVGTSRRLQADFEITYQPGELIAIAYTAGKEVGRTLLASGAGTPRLRVTTDRQRITAGTQDAAFVRIDIVDATGILRPLAATTISVTVSGSGVLAGLASANPAPTTAFGATTVETFDGSALAVVRPTGVGDIELHVQAEGLAPAQVQLTVIPAVPIDEPIHALS